MNEFKENIQPHDQFLHNRKKNCYSNLKIQIFPPHLTEEEINLLLNMQPSSKYLHNEWIISTYSNVDVCTKVFIHKKTEEQVDADVVLPSKKAHCLILLLLSKMMNFK